MFEEKTYFKFTLGKWMFIFKDNYEYTDRETGKAHFNKVFSIKKATESDTITYDDKRHHIRFSLGWGQVYLYLYLPIINKNTQLLQIITYNR